MLFTKLPLKEVLEYDKVFFEKILHKLKQAHSMRVRNMQQQLKLNAFNYLKNKIGALKEQIQTEFISLLKQYKTLHAESEY
mmetsp:Transcript_28285/g.27224  ORF Transcript_28285/g.27224 Transcript_28285/m.27224 type:complete len:81 (+) Transcript_28285:374-616(+)